MSNDTTDSNLTDNDSGVDSGKLMAEFTKARRNIEQDDRSSYERALDEITDAAYEEGWRLQIDPANPYLITLFKGPYELILLWSEDGNMLEGRIIANLYTESEVFEIMKDK